MRPLQATYLAWLDLRAYGDDDPAATALAKGRVRIEPGHHFQPGLTGHVRLNIATSDGRLREPVRRLRRPHRLASRRDRGSHVINALLVPLLAIALARAVPVGPVPPDPRVGERHAPQRAVVVVVGDIACAPDEAATRTTCRDAATARLARRLHPDAVIALGDLQYPTGGWRLPPRLRPDVGRLLGRTFPVPGNHEYKTPGATGYYTYFKTVNRARPATTPARWEPGASTSSTPTAPRSTARRSVTGSTSGSRATGAPVRRSCSTTRRSRPGRTATVVPSPRSSGSPVNTGWSFLSGHDHDYERFRPMNAAGNPTQGGVVQFVVGTGGKSLYPIADARGVRRPGSTATACCGWGSGPAPSVTRSGRSTGRSPTPAPAPAGDRSLPEDPLHHGAGAPGRPAGSRRRARRTRRAR